jgi:hypothetical protein
MAQGLVSTKINYTIGQPPGALGVSRTQRKARRCSQYSCKAHSMDSIDAGSEEEDKKLSRELGLQISKKIDPLKNAKLADHLNLLWSVSQVRYFCVQGHLDIYLSNQRLLWWLFPPAHCSRL